MLTQSDQGRLSLGVLRCPEDGGVGMVSSTSGWGRARACDGAGVRLDQLRGVRPA